MRLLIYEYFCLTAFDSSRKKEHRDTEPIICHRPLSFSLHFCHLFNSFQLDALCLYKLVRLAWTDARPPVWQTHKHASSVTKHSTVWFHTFSYTLCRSYISVQHFILLCIDEWHGYGVCSFPTQITHCWRKIQEHLRWQRSRTLLLGQRGWRAVMAPLVHILYVNLSFLISLPPWFPYWSKQKTQWLKIRSLPLLWHVIMSP